MRDRDSAIARGAQLVLAVAVIAVASQVFTLASDDQLVERFIDHHADGPGHPCRASAVSTSSSSFRRLR